MLSTVKLFIELFREHGARGVFVVGWVAMVITVAAVLAQQRPTELLAHAATAARMDGLTRWLTIDGPLLVTAGSPPVQGVLLVAAVGVFALMVCAALVRGRARPVRTGEEAFALLGTLAVPTLWVALLGAAQTGPLPSLDAMLTGLPWVWIGAAVAVTAAGYVLSARIPLLFFLRPVADACGSVLAAAGCAAVATVFLIVTVPHEIARKLVGRRHDATDSEADPVRSMPTGALPRPAPFRGI
ncbi:hypothetical protein [Microbacterium lacticum]